MGIRHVVLIGAVLLLGACSQQQFGDSLALDPEQGPGSAAWENDDVTCSADADCNEYESCISGICQMRRCIESGLRSAAPLGDRNYLSVRRELLVASGSAEVGETTVDGFRYDASNFTRPTGSTNHWVVDSSVAITDVAGGNFFDSQPEGFAVITEGKRTLLFQSPTAQKKVTLTFVPVAIAAGDTDSDGRDEVVAVGAGGEIAVCDALKTGCQSAAFQRSWSGRDVAVADIDSDGYDEPIFLVADTDSKIKIVAWNRDFEKNAQAETISVVPTKSIFRIAAADVDNDTFAEVFGLFNSGNLSVTDDIVYTFSGKDALAESLKTLSVNSKARDITAGDMSGDNKSEVVVLGDDSLVQVFKAGTTAGTLVHAFDKTLNVSNANRLGLSDINGDSPIGQLLQGPALISGEAVPLAVLIFPPFSRTFSNGFASVGVGQGQSQSNDLSKTVSMGLGISAGYSIGLSSLFSVSSGVSISRSLSRTQTTSRGVSVGQSFWFGARAERYGSEYAGIVVACGCYHAYTYQLMDPQGTLPAVNGDKFTVFLPIGGQTALWSTRRYNAMAKAIGNLPLVNVKHTIGQPTTYPTRPTTLAGEPIAAKDMVFPRPPTFHVSDLGSIGWSMGQSQSATNSNATGSDISLSSSLNFSKLSLSTEISQGWSTENSVSVGKDISFEGDVPGLPDDPGTPEDEYLVYGYDFMPYVYRERYNDGVKDLSYYVLTYTVTR